MSDFCVSSRPLNKSSTPCRNGPNCKFGANCKFWHPTSVSTSVSLVVPIVNSPPVHTQSIVQTTLVACRYGLQCKKGRSCTFFHGEADDEDDAMTFEEFLMIKNEHVVDVEFEEADNQFVENFNVSDDQFAEFEQDPDAYTDEMA